MATAKLLEHLENIKIFSDFKNSGLSSINEFWKRIDQGQSIENLTSKKIKFRPNDGYDPTDKEIKESEERREWLERTDLTELYLDIISQKIVVMLECDEADIPKVFELRDLKSIVNDNDNLKSFLAIDGIVFEEYIAFSEGIPPEDFFSEYQTRESYLKLNAKSVDTIFEEYQNIESGKYPEVFTQNGFRFFKLLINTFPESDSNCAYIFWRLKEDKYINDVIRESDFTRFLDEQSIVTGRLKPFHLVTTEIKTALYNLLQKFLE